MQSAYVSPTTQSYGPWLSFVKPKYRKGYQIPGMEMQTGGIKSFTLWNTRESVIRILPGYDPMTGEIYPQNINCKEFTTDGSYEHHLSDTFMMASMVNRFGQQNMTFLTSYAPGSPDAQRWGGNTVIKIFTRNIANSVLATNNGKKSRFGVTAEMKRWCDPMQGPLKYDHMALLVQALVFKINGNDNKDSNGNLLVDGEGNAMPVFGVVAIDSKASIGALMQALVEPANPGLPLNPSTNSKYGALAELAGNVLYLNPVDNPNGKGHMLRPSVQPPGKGWTPTPFDLSEEDVKSLWVPWEDLLYYMTAEEQLKYLAGEFGADSVNYFVGTDPLFAGKLEIPQEIAAAGFGRYREFVSGGNQPQKATPASAPRVAFGMPKAAVAAVKHESFDNPVEDALSDAHIAAPKPNGPIFGNTHLGTDGTFQSAPPRPKVGGLSGLRPNSTIDQDKLKAALSGIRGASQSNQASMAANLLNDTDLADYQDNIPEEEQ